ncbi:hypothetical protein E1287_39095 [Actinomadura sp. KC06]|uniref:hypothetical protein n=1 Tax=Actinomadura sp. KC06 TaxID=2530369 RepID=UPI001046EB19|nr:hypothetical protein [Actinomadura sp. KC06]TDD23331.1 hypothetical protein E1287_39095 [Actinomadura sp. KC06]
MRLVSRRSALSTGATGLAVVGGVIAPLPEAAATGNELSYVCSTPSGTYDVTMRASSSRSSLTAKPGKALAPGGVTLSLRLPERMVSDVQRLVHKAEDPVQAAGVPGARLSAVLRSTVTISHAGRLTDAGWPSFRLAASGEEPSRPGPLELKGTSSVPAVTFASPGEVAWIVPNLNLELNGDDGSAGTPPVQAVCALKSYGTVIRGSVSGSGTALAPGGESAGGPAANEQVPDEDPTCAGMPAPTEPGGGYNEDPAMSVNTSDFPKAPPEARYLASAGRPQCARQSGFANSKKLGAALPLGVQGRIRNSVEAWVDRGDNNYIQYRGYILALPATSRTTMLGFGFMPTTVTARMTQVPGAQSKGNRNANFRADMWNTGGIPTVAVNTIWVKASTRVQVAGVMVNGTPIAVGEECGAGPMPLTVSSYLGNHRIGATNFTDGGTYTGHVEVPAFSGCGVGEDLSPLLTATTSGTGNYVQLESGRWCTLNANDPDPSKCPADTNTEPKTVTISPGGEVTAVAKPFEFAETDEPRRVIRCESATMKFTLPHGHWQPRFKLATIKSREFSGCSYGASGIPVAVKVNPEPWSFNVSHVLSETGEINARVFGVQLTVAVRDQDVDGDGAKDTCELRLGSLSRLPSGGNYSGFTSFGGEYADNALKAEGLISNLQTGDCPSGMWTAGQASMQGSFDFDPGQKIIMSKQPE